MPSAPPSSVDRFVGRQAELTSLQWALERSGGGAGRVVLLSGEPGVGKTRLAEHFADRCAASGREVHWARCWEWGGAPALWPWIQLVRSLCGVAEALSLDESARTALRDAERMLSPEQVGAAEVATTADGRAVHFAILDAVCAALATVSERAPLLLLIDDLHAADPSSIQLLRFFARDTRRRRVLVVATCRMAEMHCSEEVAGLLGALPRDCAELHVVGLGAGELRELAAGLTDAPLSDAAVQRLLEATDGNALYVQGVLQEAMAAGSFDLERHTAPPRGLRDAIERRLSVLGPEDRQVLEVAAVLGHDAPVGVIARAAEEVWGVTRTAVERAIDWALRESLLREVEGGRGRVRFAHSLIADALSRQLGAEHRARLHAAVGEGLRTLGDDGGVQATRLARHFLAAGPAYRRAGAAYAAAAAKRAFAVCAYDQAALLHERVLEAFALDGSQEPQAIAELLLGLARARQLSGRNQAARAALRRAGQLDVDAATFARASLAMAETTGFATHDKEAAAMLEEALTRLQQVEQGHARELRARVLSALARQLSHAADSRPRRLELIAHARALMHDLPDPAARVRALSAQLAADWNPESLAERLELTEELVDTTATLGDAVAHLEALRWQLNALWEQGQTAEANATLDAYCGVAAELKWPQAQFNAALRLVVQAEIATVLPALQDAIDRMAHWAPRTSDPHTDAHLGGVRMSASWLRGDVPAMTASYEAFQTMIGVFRLLPAPDALQINYELLIGETDRARRRYERYAAADFSNVRTGFGTVCAYAHLAEACRAFEDRDRAARLIEILTPYADRLAVAGPVTCAGSVRRSLGCLELLRGDVPAAVTHLERAHGASVRMGAAGWQARAALDLADALTRRGEGLDLERAAELREAHPDRPLVFDARPPSAQGLAVRCGATCAATHGGLARAAARGIPLSGGRRLAGGLRRQGGTTAGQPRPIPPCRSCSRSRAPSFTRWR